MLQMESLAIVKFHKLVLLKVLNLILEKQHIANILGPLIASYISGRGRNYIHIERKYI